MKGRGGRKKKNEKKVCSIKLPMPRIHRNKGAFDRVWGIKLPMHLKD